MNRYGSIELPQSSEFERSLDTIAGLSETYEEETERNFIFNVTEDEEMPLISISAANTTSSVCYSTNFVRMALFMMGFLPCGQKSKRIFRYMLCALIVFCLSFNVLEEIYYAYICFDYKTGLNKVFCVYEVDFPRERNSTARNNNISFHGNSFDPTKRKIGGYFGLTMAISNFISYFLLQNLLYKLGKTGHFFMNVNEELALVSEKDWRRISTRLLVWLIYMSSMFLWAFVRGKGDFVHATVLIFLEIGMMSNLISCLFFALFMVALKVKADNIQKQIMELKQGTVDDVIDCHKELCKAVFATSSLFKNWFVFHWLGYCSTAALYFIFFFHSVLSAPLDHLFFTMSIDTMFMAYMFYVFLSPCLDAASVTYRCKTILLDINILITVDWQRFHPFRSRAAIREFLEYAQFAQCGYRVGRFVVSLSFVYTSLFSSLVGIFWKILGLS